MTEKEKLSKAEKRVWKLLRKLYNKGYLIALGYERGNYNFSFWCNNLHVPDKKIK